MILQVVGHAVSVLTSRSTIQFVVGFLVGGYLTASTEWGAALNTMLVDAVTFVVRGIAGG